MIKLFLSSLLVMLSVVVTVANAQTYYDDGAVTVYSLAEPLPNNDAVMRRPASPVETYSLTQPIPVATVSPTAIGHVPEKTSLYISQPVDTSYAPNSLIIVNLREMMK